MQASTRKNFTTNWSIFPPHTKEIQFDEKWAFVQKKEKNCDENNPDDARCGDNWDHVALDAEHKLVLEVVNGKRTEANTQALVRNTAKRLNFKPPRLITSDEWKAYKKAILTAFGHCHIPPPTGKRGHPRKPVHVPPPDLVYATVHKTRENGRVTDISQRIVFGTETQVVAALKSSKCSRAVNTSFIERHNGTDRNRCSRKVRKFYCFSKNWDVHRAASCFSVYTYNFCWPVRTLSRPDGHPGPCTPALSARLIDHVWTIREC